MSIRITKADYIVNLNFMIFIFGFKSLNELLSKHLLIQTLSETTDGPREDQQAQNQQGRKLGP